ncbi:MAG: hypothetical protein P4M14_03470 [Gammaproteobacteria bacterium]|nr:hypothetical protein [Gammaproteobacteria bacterium]
MQKLDIKLKPSKFFIVLASLTLILTLVLIISLNLNRWARAFLLAVTMRYGISIIRNYGLLTGGPAISKLTFDASGWLLHDRLRTSSAELCPDSTITTWLCILRFQITGQKQKRTCLIFRDSLAADTYRQLLVQLRTNQAYEAEKARH